MAIILDLETVGDESVAIELEEVTAPGNYKDPVKIADYIAEETKKRTLEAEKRRSLYPWSNKIVAAGYAFEGDEVVTVMITNSDANESGVIRELARVIADGQDVHRIITFNGRSFDLPTLMSRARLLGIPFPRLQIDRYRSPHRDILIDEVCYGDPRAVPMRSLTWVAKRFGLDVSDAFSGKEVAQLYQDQNWDAIKKHVESDVTLTRQLAERFGVIRQRVRV